MLLKIAYDDVGFKDWTYRLVSAEGQIEYGRIDGDRTLRKLLARPDVTEVRCTLAPAGTPGDRYPGAWGEWITGHRLYRAGE